MSAPITSPEVRAAVETMTWTPSAVPSSTDRHAKPPVTIYPDPVRGHVALATTGPAEATFVDLGDGHLDFWSHTSGRIDPAGARDLAAALSAWADKQDARATAGAAR